MQGVKNAESWPNPPIQMFDRYNIIDEADLAQGVAKRF